LLIATLWAGSLWTIGYLVAPTLFSQLSDRVLAGTIAGTLFRVEAWVSVGCALSLFVLIEHSSEERRWGKLRQLVVAMLGCTLIGYFALHPWMAALREAAGPQGIAQSPDKSMFGILHAASSIFYLAQSLLAAVLVLRIR
jgi:hypothetical protein